MDLRKFYLENISKNEPYYRYYGLVKNVNKSYNIFAGEQETFQYQFAVDSIDEAIEKFKYLCQPENEYHDVENSCWFYLILFYLNKCGYVVEEFPRLVANPPKESYDFVNKAIRNRLISEGKEVNGKVPYRERRELIAKLTFSQVGSCIVIEDEIERKFTEISNRHASFNNMSTDEKLAEIANLIESMLKKSGKFATPDYSQVCLDYISDDVVKRFRSSLHCFRHSTSEAISERISFTSEQKTFLIDFGLTILKSIHVLTSDQ